MARPGEGSMFSFLSPCLAEGLSPGKVWVTWTRRADALRMADIEPGPNLKKSRIREILGQLPRESPRPAQSTEEGGAQARGGERLLQAGVNNAMLGCLQNQQEGRALVHSLSFLLCACGVSAWCAHLPGKPSLQAACGLAQG